jgi:Na+-transporting NADH:ubiquinone oxidoreductase subunit NqrB
MQTSLRLIPAASIGTLPDMLKFIDSLLDRVTMYRLLLYYLIGLLTSAALLSQLGYIHYDPIAIIFSAAYLAAVCWVSNLVFANAFNAPANRESSLLTGLILALIITPVTDSGRRPGYGIEIYAGNRQEACL